MGEYLIFYATFIIPLSFLLRIVSKIDLIQKHIRNWKGFCRLVWTFFILNALIKLLFQHLFWISLVRSPYIAPLIIAEFFILGKILFAAKNVSYSSIYQVKLLTITKFLYSPKTQKETFEKVVADWQTEYFEALSKKEIWKARWLNVRYTYAYFGAMWQKSPVGDLIEFIRKIAK